MTTTIGGPGQPERTDTAGAPGNASGRATRWWRRPWVVPVVMVSAAFVAFSLPPYLTLDPAMSRVPSPENFPPHYPLLVGHVLFGSVALLTCSLQIWPWLRQRHPGVHRISGRVYVFGGVIPGGVLGMTIGTVSPFGPMVQVSNVLLAALWLTFTIKGFRCARAGRFHEHRRWMIRSFALTVSIMTNRVWGVVWVLVLSPQLPTTFAGNEVLMAQTVAGLSAWLGWVVTLLIAEWWLERGDMRTRAENPR